MVAQCIVCGKEGAGYKCPVCRRPYCSVVCYKVHKEVPCSKPDDVAREEAALRQPPRQFENDTDESGTRLNKDQLEALATSDEIRRMLRDEALQKLILKIDSAEEAEKELDLAMQDPAVQEFAQKVLGILTPEEPAPQ
ncbi:hypothetical protein KFL_004220110 [Klebsormidium nitens]|uniref:Zinc finger HIT domain-containing protein 3 n=1 Tax=Klebsormidium nitens TaxID=105231 RepID=A0A1Y1IEH5_KLENI|nr:hypothetical protein KFL_004220110 [Klebsormidium nitens]|eukprot:GAQ88372.1 hypothetical protein KFL_004220110 [Klebsormidium nitens]